MNRSHLLINEPALQVLPSLAKVIGLNEAIVLQQLHYWLNNPKVGIEKQGEKWIFNTYEEWVDNFPFWSVSTVKRIFTSLEEQGVVISAQLEAKQRDMTKFYRIDYVQLEALEQVKLNSSIGSRQSDVNNESETTTENNNESLKTDELQGDYIAEADKTVDAILEAERNAHEAGKQGKAWRGRELVMDAYLPYGDWWHKKTGLHMYAAKAKPKANSSWIKEFQAWWENDLTTEVLELAFQAEVSWRGVITHPRELTAKAIALSVNPNPMPAKNQPPVSNVKRSTTVQYDDDGAPITF